MRKFFIVLITIIFSLFLFVPRAMAQTIVEREDLNFDEGLSDQDQNIYKYIDSACIVAIKGGQSSGFGDGQEWMKGLYYYMITHLGFLDVPFHYIVTWQGDIYEGRGGGWEVNSLATFELEKDYNNPLLIGYFDNGRGLTNQGEAALESLLGKSMSSFWIETTDVFAGNFSFNISEEGQPSYLSVTPATEGYLVDWLLGYKEGYVSGTGLGLELSGDVESVTYSETANSWQDIDVEVVIKNTGDFPWYNSGARATYLATSSPRSHSSDFYYPDGWSSFSRVVTPVEEVVMPGESATFEFIARAPVVPDTYTEKFELLRLPSGWVDDSTISMTITVTHGNLQLVEIRETGTGALTVRSCGHPSCEQISAVETGYTTILLEEKVGWSKIIYDGVNVGWVFGEYVKKL